MRSATSTHAITTGTFPHQHSCPTHRPHIGEGTHSTVSVDSLNNTSTFLLLFLQLKFKLFKEENNQPGEVIIKLAEDEKADFIVMGSRGVGTLRRTFLGSVSDYCVHHTKIPVVVVPPPPEHSS